MLLRYVGEADLAFGAPAATAQRRGGTLRVGTVAYNRSLEPYGLQEAGSLGLAGIPGEYLHVSEPQLEVKPCSRRMETERGLDGLDVPAPAR